MALVRRVQAQVTVRTPLSCESSGIGSRTDSPLRVVEVAEAQSLTRVDRDLAASIACRCLSRWQDDAIAE